MSTTTIRNKLIQYIQVADNDHLKALYTLLEDRIEQDLPWFEKVELIQEFTSRYENWKKGQEKGYSISDIDAEIEKIKAARKI